MNNDLNILMLEDDPADAELIRRLLQKEGLAFRSVLVNDENSFLNAISEQRFDAVLADNALPGYSSMEALRIIRIHNPYAALILVTGTVSEEFAVNIIKEGADDYILKNNLIRLPAALGNALEKKRHLQEKQEVESAMETEKELSDAIINSLPGIFYFCDNKGNFLRWNKNFEQISGYSAKEIVQMSPDYFFTNHNREDYTLFFRKVLSTGYGSLEADFITRQMDRVPYFFTGMAIQLSGLNCLVCIGIDISAKRKAEEDLRQANTKLHRVTGHLEKIREEEQARIAREIHDQLGQQITGLKMDLSRFRDYIQPAADLSLLNEKIREMDLLLDETVNTIRKIASDLRPSILDDFGLVEALEWKGHEFRSRFGIPVKVVNLCDDQDFGIGVATVLFRIFQEALTNIARHAGPCTVHCTLETLLGQLILRIQDDGAGFDSSAAKDTLGMLGMKERAFLIGGSLRVISEPGKGTTITVTVPLGGQE
ncbi:MAG: response regulator [Bacteroidetes bacterium]|nr:response regulator [Bacteroidota bacterium]